MRDMIAAFDGTQPPRALFFGDSVFLRVADEDQDRRPLGQMLEQASAAFGGGVSIAHSAFNLKIFEALHGVLDSTVARPHYVVLPINLRSFSPQWFHNPAWQFDEHLRLIRLRAADRTAALGPVGDVRAPPGFYDAFEALPVSYPLSPFTTVKQFRDIIVSQPEEEDADRRRLATIMVFHYTHPLSPDHPLLDCLDALIAHGAKLGSTVLPVLLPLNMELGEMLVGPAFAEIVRANKQRVMERCQAAGATAIDLVDMLPPDAFFHLNSPTEHLRDHGRLALTARIMHALAERGR
ncbi:MAG: hypothetical protein NVV74_04840 [Magnetospirillum sp.]|nr:hypothetical protein [Magnetospirillum sp.]